MSTSRSNSNDPAYGVELTVEDLIAAVGARPVTSVEDLVRFAADTWDSDSELDDFLADVRASRHADPLNHRDFADFALHDGLMLRP